MSATATSAWATGLEDQDAAEDPEAEDSLDVAEDAPSGHSTATKGTVSAPAATGTPTGTPTGTTTARRPKRASGSRRTVELTLAVSHLEPRQRELLAHLNGLRGYDDGEPFMVRLVLASLDQGSRAGAVLGQLLEIAKASPLEAGVLATELAGDRAVLAVAWAALASLGAVSGAAPASQAHAGLAVAKAAQGLSATALEDLSGVLEAIGD